MNTATRLGTKSALLSVSSYLILAPSALGAGLVHGRDVDRGGAPGCQFNSILIFGPFFGCVFGCIFRSFLLLTVFSWDIYPFSKFHFGAVFGAVFGPFLMLLNCAPVLLIRHAAVLPLDLAFKVAR